MVRLAASNLPCFFRPSYGRWLGAAAIALSLLGADAAIAPWMATAQRSARAVDSALAIAAPTAQGQTITINGNSFASPWMATANHIGLADYGLVNTLGATLLSSGQPELQPVQWFTDPAGAIDLSAWVQDGYRYLDITPLAQRYGWQVQPSGNTLQITMSPAQILALRRELIPGGERLVIDLSGPAFASLGPAAGALALTLGATPNPSVVEAAIAAPPGPYLGTLSATPVGSGIRLQASSSHPPRVTSQASPPQIIVDTRVDHLQPHSIAWAPGLRWQQRYVAVGGQAFPVYWLQIDPAQASLRPIWPDPTTVVGTAPLTTIAQRWQATAAINAGFFNRNNQYPLGAVRANNDWISGPILSRGVVGWNDQGQVRMERLFLQQILTAAGGRSFPIQAINSGYVQAGIGLYTPAWGATYRPILADEIVVTVVDGVVTAQQPAATIGATGLPIPANGYLLALRSFATAAPALPLGQAVALASDLLPATMAAFPQMMGGGPLLIRDRTLVLDAGLEQFSPAFGTQAAPRSAIGLTAAGEILLVAVHHSPLGPGPTLEQLAQIMLQLGSTEALNLDGGSSASLYLGGRLINRPPETAARVSNGIGLFLP
jgi:hypothetical protein